MFKKIKDILTVKEYLIFKKIIFLNLMLFFLETVSILSIPLFISVLVDKSIFLTKIQNIEFLSFLLNLNYAKLVLYSSSLVVGTFVLKNIYVFGLAYFQANFFKSIRVSLAQKIFNHYIKMPFINHLEKDPATLSRYISSEISGFYTHLINLTLFIRESITVLVIFFILLYASPVVVVITASSFSLIVILYIKTVKPIIKQKAEKNQKLVKDLIQTVYESFSAIKDIKIQSKENDIIKYFQNNSNTLEKNNAYFEILERLPKIILELLSVITIIIISVFFLNFENNFLFAIPILSLITICIVRFIPAFNALTVSKYYMKLTMPHVNILQKELEEIKKIENVITNNFNKDTIFNKNFISVNNLFFTYPNLSAVQLKNINFQIKEGSTVGITGNTGAGKSTLFHLMLGLLMPKKGNISCEGKNILENLENWKSNIGYISQNIFLLDSSIKKNIIFSFIDELVDEKKLSLAIDIAQLRKKINSLPNGVETNVGNDGIKLSGGERQRIAIARAIYRNPKILFMDESTSALDIKTENLILNDIKKNFPNKTIIMIAHRKTSLEKCDKVWILENGEISLK